MGPCMCGDTRCFYCGPAQGNHQCEVCGEWTEDGGCVDAGMCDKIIADRNAAYAEDIQWEREHAEEIDRIIREQ